MSLFNNKNNSNKKTSGIATFISREMEVRGDFKGEGTIKVDGVLHGNISVKSVVINESGIVNGDIKANSIIIKGEVKGDILALNMLDIASTGYIQGKIILNKLIINEGARVIGSIEEITKEEEKVKVEATTTTDTQPKQKEEVKKPHPKGKKG